MDTVSFKSEKVNGLTVLDLNFVEGSSIFESSAVFAPNDTRDYIFWLKPTNEASKIDSTKEMILGKLDLQWRSYFGDTGNLLIGPYKAPV
jgi:hypothetical protein